MEACSAEDRDWLRRGVDIWMIRANLQLSYEARIAQHQDTLDTIMALQQMRSQQESVHHAESPSAH
ncbi:MAG: hypothetical protein HY696_12035 [Deltaproteobacteria bacterium]|nr:hypothetical protein [Deltaproteobacteria bacterium]